MSLFAEYEPAAQGRPVAARALAIRKACVRDVPRLAQLSRQRHGGQEHDHLRSWRIALQEAQDEERALILVAVILGEQVAFGSARCIDPRDEPAYRAVPAGWYLTGVIVDPAHRRRGIGHALTQARLHWVEGRAACAYYFASAQNRATIDLHKKLGFVELTRDFSFPRITFTGGVGILFRTDFRTRT
ncbi:MAG: GNAT family N-acetyltransferase [Planctomycetota bacterium]|nr:GNAT family N-acetyltransferase [Planctomycetota bacterium]